MRVFGFVFFAVVQFSFAAWASLSTPNFHPVEDALYRSARPEASDFDQFKAMGIRTIVNLENDMAAVKNESTYAEAAGIRYISIPMSAWSKPKDADVNRILELLQDKNNGPLLLHCMHGEDRTGLIIGLRRVFSEGWTPGKAHDEMLAYGFHTALISLENYFRQKTGF